MTSAITIVEATSAEQFQEAVPLTREFLAWVRERYRETPHIIDTYYDATSWEKELVSLHKQYATPNGLLLLASVEKQPAGCVAMRKLDNNICEMKRLYVREQFQKLGIGRNLCEYLLRSAKNSGFRRMRLETGDEQMEAQSLYRSIGFYEIGAYHAHPVDLLRRMVFMEVVLQ
jgi:ribosomal protein S18 acetylase RimI-like enzyme